MKHGDLFVVQNKNHIGLIPRTTKVFHTNTADDDSPYDYFTVPQGSYGIFLESNGGMHKVLFPEYGVGWVWVWEE